MERNSNHRSNEMSLSVPPEKMMRIVLEATREHDIGLNEHREFLLDRVPERNTFASFNVNTIECIDLAFLSAETGDEFALLRGKQNDILYHGFENHCHIENSDVLMTWLKNHVFSLEAYTHSDRENIILSDEDRALLDSVEQEYSKIVSSHTGEMIRFSTKSMSMKVDL